MTKAMPPRMAPDANTMRQLTDSPSKTIPPTVASTGGRRSARHPGGAVPTLLEAAFHQFTASTEPAMLRHMLQVVQQLARPCLLGRMMNPDLWQALIRRQLTRHAGQILALHAGDDAFVI